MKRIELQLSILLSILFSTAFAAENTWRLDARLKAAGSYALLRASEVRRLDGYNELYDGSLDLRLKIRHKRGRFSIAADYELLAVAGDSLSATLTPNRENDRFFDLEMTLERGDKHLLRQRLDRLYVEYRHGDWRVILGRQAISWGYGLAFQVADLFNPFAPTETDRDYKAGDDMLLVQHLLPNGWDLQLLAKGSDGGNFQVATASLASRLSGLTGALEWSLYAALHKEDPVVNFGITGPLFGAVWRFDYTASRVGSWHGSMLANLDYGLPIGARNLYLFAEYYRNAFGNRNSPLRLDNLREENLLRLGRGEVFTLMRNYLALGATMEWHPLWQQTTLILGNLDDGSWIVQSALRYVMTDWQTLEFGLAVASGSAGEEFGGVLVGGTDPGRARRTSGIKRSAFLRYYHYF